MTIELIFLLILIGAGTGAVSSVVAFPPSFIAISAAYFFLPFDNVFLPVIATCLMAFLPVHLYAWVKLMKRHKVDFPLLIQFSPGIALGAIIGAQVLSFMEPVVFKVCFTALALSFIYNLGVSSNLISFHKRTLPKAMSLPVGMGVGSISLLAGNCGRVLGEFIYNISNKDTERKEGTVLGFIIFSSIAALIGFIFPAQDVETYSLYGFAGAIHLPSLMVIGGTHSLFYYLFHERGNELDNNVLLICCLLFTLCTLFRLWF
ncbi:sulfite exporter TauE/SafE family protein [Marinomonas sp.]|nr:sulfite exporter TauE/SafE family protein [Marinomonas sp.]MDB4837070.1 sulfite exporter TauE/SafE family protein [Marinomonas sp.]